MSTDKIFLGESVRDTALWSGLGYVIGHVAKTSAEKVAAVFAVSMIADKVFFLLNSYIISDKTSQEGKKNFNNGNLICSFAIGCITAVALQRMQILSGTWAGYLALGSLIINASQYKLS